MAMIKGLALLFCYDLSEIRLERDEGEGDIQGGRKETDRGGCNIRNGEKWCEEEMQGRLDGRANLGNDETEKGLWG